MPNILMDRLSKGCRIEISMPHWGKKSKKTIGKADIRSLGLCAVTYPGSGKYRTINSATPDRALEWDELPDSGNLLELRDPLPDDATWWPAIIVNWEDQHIDHDVATREQYFTRVRCGVRFVFVICWYQLIDGSRLITAWPIFLTTPRSLL